MCGIGGIVGKRSISFAEKIIKKLDHRGPDANGYWISEDNDYPITLCHTRLSILDLSKSGSQPFFSQDKRFVLVYNGEIYNFLELKDELERKGCIFKTKSDTEVLLNGLITEGIDFQLKCNGMWAFCLWDRKLNKAIFSRDRFGVKPLYYSLLDNNTLVFASEMKAITPFLNSITPSKNIDIFIKYLFNYEATDECVLNNIKRLKSGHYLSYENGEITIKKYWNTLDNLVFNNDHYSNQVEEWQHLFLDSVKLRMRSDVPIGSALSGGLDSSSIVSAMSHISKQNDEKRLSNDWQHIFCSSFPGSVNDETKWARIVAEDLSIQFNEIVLKKSKLNYSLEDALAMVEDPYLTLPYPMLNTYSAVKSQGINVTLDGHGADELFSGYGHLKYAIASAFNIKSIRELIAIDKSTSTGIFSDKERNIKRKWVKYNIFKILSSLYYKGYGSLSRSFNNVFPPCKISPIFHEEGIQMHPAYLEMDAFSQVLFEIFHYSILPTLLRNYDKYSMANGVEIRMPFMDWRLVCNTFSLPMSSKIGAGYTKRIQRDSMKNILLDSVRLRRDKIGWNAPVQDWFRNELKVEIEDVLSKNKQSKYYKSSIESWKRFNKISNPTYQDGQKTWESILPIVWFSSLNNNLWR